MSKLGNVLFSTTQQKILGLLYGQPGRSFYLKEILQKTGMGVATIKRELDRMVDAGILKMSKIGHQHHYQANPECPIYKQLLDIVNKTFGVKDVIKKTLAPLADRVAWAFIFGSVARGGESSASDIDLMVIGDVSYSEVVGLLYPVQEKINREINPKIYTQEEWKKKLLDEDAFVKGILEQPRIDIIGASVSGAPQPNGE